MIDTYLTWLSHTVHHLARELEPDELTEWVTPESWFSIGARNNLTLVDTVLIESILDAESDLPTNSPPARR